MQTSNAKRNFKSDDPVWVLLAELSLRDFLSDHNRRDEPTHRYQFLKLQVLDMSLECVENIARTFAGFAKEALTRYEQGWLESPDGFEYIARKR